MATAPKLIRVVNVRSAPLPPPPERHSDLNSYCLYCGHWHFARRLTRCPRCHGAIFRWVSNFDLRFFRSRGTMCNL